jgi:hypothetical protein
MADDKGSGGLSAGWVAVLTVVTGLLGALAGFGGAVATGWFAFASKDEELRVRLVEIAIGILSADPSKTDLTPARGWAMDIIDQKSGVKFSDADRAALLHQAIDTKDWYVKKNIEVIPWDGDLPKFLERWSKEQDKNLKPK